MYKVVCDDNIVDLIKGEPIYIRYQNKFNRAKPTDKSSAQGFVGSDNKTIYIFPGNARPGNKTWKTAYLERITEAEYNRLSSIVCSNDRVYNCPQTLDEARNAKIEEMRKACTDKLDRGISVLLDDTLYHHFTLTVEDQLNLARVKELLDAGLDKVPYHENGHLIRLYSADEMRKIIKVADSFKTYNLTYYNLLKYCIKNIYDIVKIQEIEYSVDLKTLNLSEDLLNLLNEVAYGRYQA